MHRKIRWAVLGGCLTVAAVVGAQSTLRVPADHSTIQAAIVAAVNGDTVEVYSGHYLENIDLLGKLIRLQGVGPTRPVVDGGGVGPSVTCTSGETVSTVISGFEITGGSSGEGGGLRVNSSSVHIDSCLFRGNFASVQGGGASFVHSAAIVTHCVFTANQSTVSGGGLYSFGDPQPTVLHCTFADNCSLGDGGGPISGGGTGTLTLINCISARNVAATTSANMGAGPEAQPFYCLIEGGFLHGSDNIDADPQFVSPGTGNYRLKVGSLAIDAGDTVAAETTYGATVGSVDYDGNPRFVDDISAIDSGLAGTADAVDIGAFERTPAPCGWTPGLIPLAGLNSDVRDALLFDRGNGDELWCIGAITAGGTSTTDSELYRYTGSDWVPSPLPVSGTVNCLAVYQGELFIGGQDISVDDMVFGSVLRWDGAASFGDAGLPPDGEVHDLVVHDVGSGSVLFAAGSFGFAGVGPASNIASWNGVSWSALGSGVNGTAHVVAPAVAANTLAVGGSFSSAGGVGASNIATWNGSTWSALSGGVDNTVRALAVHDDGTGGGDELYVGGDFMSVIVPTIAAAHIAKWDGVSWSALGADHPDDVVLSLATYDDGTGESLFLGGDFNLVGASFFGSIAEWNGTAISSLDGAPINTVRHLQSLDLGFGERLLLSGNFNAGGNDDGFRGIALWDGSGFHSTVPGLNHQIDALFTYDDGSGEALYLGGIFDGFHDNETTGIARWDGHTLTAVGSGGNDLAVRVEALFAFDDGAGGGEQLYAGGSFTAMQQVPASGVARWNGSVWSAVGTGISFGVFALGAFDAGSGAKLYAGGAFTEGITVWNPTGGTWDSVGGGVNGQIRALASFDDGSGEALYAAGTFTMAGGSPAANVARWDGTTWSALGAPGSDGIDGAGRALAVFAELPGGVPGLYVGGFFPTAGGVLAPNVAIWRGSSWSAPPNIGGLVAGGVSALLVRTDAIGPGLFIAGNGATSRYDGVNLDHFDGGISGTAMALASYNDAEGNSLYVGGHILGAGDLAPGGEVGAAMLARWVAPPLQITLPPTVGFCDGGGLSITPTLNNEGRLFQWRKGGIDLPGQTQQTLLIPQATVADVGNYDVVVTTNCDTATSGLVVASLGGCDFIRGDIDGSGSPSIADAVLALGYLFQGQSVPCQKALDVTDDGAVTITDAFSILCFLFCAGSPPPNAPFPGCGPDPSSDGLSCDLPPAGCP